MKNRTTLYLALLALMTGSTLVFAAIETNKGQNGGTATETEKTTQETPAVATKGAAKLSFGLDDVLKMVQSGVATDVILTYIENSTVAYYTTAEDIVQLHELGVPPQITAAMIRHGGKLRAEQAKAAKAVAVAPAATYTSASSQAMQPAPVTYNYSYSAYPYYPAYSYAYPAYSYYTYPSFYFSYSSPFYFRHYYPYRYNHFFPHQFHSGIRVVSGGHSFHGSSGIHFRGRR
jgi:hypothetical protein